ncbi:MAG TPA: VOC family protein [Candidatus Sulfotelmatobacter sp.]|nr:VOC family protein [Candidatus Sulfotelmatobacter sp.]
MFDHIHHVAIVCSDYARSKHFYVDLLGFEIVRETYRKDRSSFKLDLKLGETCAIELFSFPNPPKRLTHPEACGLRHIAFAVENLQSTIHQLTSKGVAVEAIRKDELTGKRFTFFRDPDDLPIEVYER